MFVHVYMRAYMYSYVACICICMYDLYDSRVSVCVCMRTHVYTQCRVCVYKYIEYDIDFFLQIWHLPKLEKTLYIEYSRPVLRIIFQFWKMAF